MLSFEVFFNYKYLTNIIYFAAVVSKFRINIDTELDPSINVHLNNGTGIIFNQYGGSLYYFYTTN